MRREEVRHIARAAAQVAGVTRILVVGSQAVLGTYPEGLLPERATRSMEADIVVLDDDDAGTLANLVDGSIGYGSPFHSSFRVYADGEDKATSRLPDGWEGRVETEDIPGSGTDQFITVHYLEVHDLCIAKLAAGRPQDLEFVEALAEASLIQCEVLVERAGRLTDADDAVRRAVSERAESLAARFGDGSAR